MVIRSFLFILLFLTSVIELLACDTTFRVIRERAEDADELFARHVIEKAGCQIEVIKPEKGIVIDRRLILIKSGYIDLLAGVSKRPEREQYGYFSKPFRSDHVRAWVKKEDKEKFTDFNLTAAIDNGITLIGPNAGWFGPEYEALKKSAGNNLIQITYIAHGIELLVRSRGDVFIGSSDFENRFPPELRDKIVMLPLVVYEDTNHLMYSKKTVPLETVNSIDKVIEEVLSQSPNQ